jgi:hypothetical protein
VIRGVLLLSLVLLGAASARAERPRARCEAVQLGRRTSGRVELAHFLDGQLLRLVRLGLEGRFHLEVRLLRRRFAWFDELEVSVEQDIVLSWDEAGHRYLLDGRPVDLGALDPIRLERVPLGRRDASPGSHYLEVEGRLQVVTVSSLRGVANWVTGGGGSPSAISRRLARAVVEDLIRRASGSCDVVVKR